MDPLKRNLEPGVLSVPAPVTDNLSYGVQDVSGPAAPAESVRNALTRSITCLMAAELIADPSFPIKQNLPRLFPPPFNNHGHFLLLDYKLMLTAVWNVIAEIQKTLGEWTHKHTPLLFASAAISIISLFSVWILARSFLGGVVAAGLAFAINYCGGRVVLSLNGLTKKVSEIRASALLRLLQEQPPGFEDSEIQSVVEEKLSRVGDGALREDRIPLLVIFDDDEPFPGYGKLQADRSFVCAPKKDHVDQLTDFEMVRKGISTTIHAFRAKCGLGNVSFGPVFTIHGRSLRSDSPLLERELSGDRVPPLWIPGPTSGAELQRKDPRVSVREYVAVQILFPTLMTAATIFSRPFWAGNGVGFQLALTTLGPPFENTEHLLGRLLRHEFDKSKSKDNSVSRESGRAELVRVRELRRAIRSGLPFRSSLTNTSAIRKLRMDFAESPESYREEAERLARESVVWPGFYLAPSNWRESRSYTFATEFFGRAEALACVKLLYTEISKAIIDGLDAMGFDVAEYRDKEGRYSIHAENIDKVIIGERIHMDNLSEKKGREPRSTPSTGAARETNEESATTKTK